MSDKTHQARLTALSLAQCNAMAGLLRAHGEEDHAENLDAAIDAVVSLVSKELGRRNLEQAMTWAAEELGVGEGLADRVTTTH